MSGLASLRENLTAEQRALFDLRLRKKRPDLFRLQPIARRTGDGPSPLTYEQERLWFVQQIFPENGAYNVSNNFHLRGRLEPPVLARAVEEIVRRHEILRTSFRLEDDRPVQIVMPPGLRALPEVDLAALPEPLPRREAGRTMSRRARQRFDLTTGEPLRVTLFRLAAEEVQLLATMHHVATDFWSFAVFRNELVTLYAAFSRGQRSPLPELPIQFADFACWQRAWLDSEWIDRQLAYWRDRLRGAPAALDLPADRPRPPVASFAGARSAFDLPSDVSEALRGFARRLEATPFVVQLAAFAALLSRWSGERDLTCGTPIADRNRTEVENLIGYLLNLLVLRIEVGSDPTLQELTTRVRGISHEAYAHQDLPFGKLLEGLRPGRALDRMPLFQVAYIYVTSAESSASAASLAEAALGGVPLDPGTARVDLTFVAEDYPSGFRCFFEYGTDLFDAPTVLRLSGWLTRILERMAGAPETKLGDVSLLSAAERWAAIGEWNDSARGIGAMGTSSAWSVDAWIDAEAERRPDAIALVARERALSYRELARRSAGLARLLAACGAGPEVAVAVVAERSPDYLLALLGVLRAGAFFVPLDPESPPFRLAAMIEDARPRLLLADGAGRRALADLAIAGVETLDLESALASAAMETVDPSPAPCLSALPPAEALAYVLFTSGSTGRPKGVGIPRGALANLIRALCDLFGLGEGDRWLATTATTFDISLLELLAPLARGGVVEVAGVAEVRDGFALGEWIGLSRPTFLQATPTGWRHLLEAGWHGDPGLTALSGGEALPPPLAREIAARSRALWNLYGPTETTIWSTAAAWRRGQPVTIGRPIDNTACFLLDGGLEPAPIGTVGDLYLAGSGLARGYRGRPDLTALAFVPDPFSTFGGRLYRTGDRARRRPDGRLEFLGRGDQQVKVRGSRIEIGEIEAALAHLPGVAAGAVVAVAGEGGELRLIASLAVAGADRPPLSLGEVRRLLAERLPASMIPASFRFVAALPRTANDKLDRRALAAQAREVEPDAPGGRQEAPPETPEEEVLCAVWAEVLGLESVGTGENFFELGGDSILSLRIASRARRAGLSIAPRQLFQHQTVAELARALSRAPAPAGGAPRALYRATIEELREVGSGVEDVYPLTPLQAGLRFESLASPLGVYLFQWHLCLDGPLRPGALRAALEAVTARHPSLRTAFFDRAERRAVQAVFRQVRVPFAQIDWTALPAARHAEALANLLAADLRRGIDPARPPLLRWALVRLGERRYRLLWTFHHLILDGWSVPIVLREIFALYLEAAGGRPASLPPAPPFRDHVEWLERQDTAAAERFWRTGLRGIAPSPFAAKSEASGRKEFRERGALLGEPATERLRAVLPGARLTLQSAVLGAWGSVLAFHAKRAESVVGVAVSGRSAELGEVDSRVGMYVNTLPCRVRPAADRPALEWLSDLQNEQQAARGFDYAGVDQIRAWSGLARGAGLFDSLFTFVNMPTESLLASELPSAGLSVAELRNETRNASVLTLVVNPGPRLSFRCRFDAAALPDAEVAELLANLVALLGDLAAEPSRPVTATWDAIAARRGLPPRLGARRSWWQGKGEV
ncbi:MAG TPA: amino acid adenylation domain-containing protein [Thermoanaerobaculia bacterium]|nr:amino acid adenylation domain-containing protein [Thermoanaerobaculia bacterium]